MHDGTPYGMRTLTAPNWSGSITICPRSALKQLEEGVFANKPALYMLFDKESLLHALLNTESLYIGETDNLTQRIKHHASTRDNWDELIAFSSGDFSKTEVKYLEYYLLQKLYADKQVTLQNKKNHNEPPIQSDVKDGLLDYLDIASDALISIGYNFMKPSEDTQNELKNGRMVTLSVGDIEATATYSGSGIFVEQGSLVKKETSDSMPKNSRKLRDELIEKGTIDATAEPYMFADSELFSSASAAASVILGYSVNGLNVWKTTDGKTLKELEQESIDV